MEASRQASRRQYRRVQTIGQPEVSSFTADITGGHQPRHADLFLEGQVPGIDGGIFLLRIQAQDTDQTERTELCWDRMRQGTDFRPGSLFQGLSRLPAQTGAGSRLVAERRPDGHVDELLAVGIIVELTPGSTQRHAAIALGVPGQSDARSDIAPSLVDGRSPGSRDRRHSKCRRARSEIPCFWCRP